MNRLFLVYTGPGSPFIKAPINPPTAMIIRTPNDPSIMTNEVTVAAANPMKPRIRVPKMSNNIDKTMAPNKPEIAPFAAPLPAVPPTMYPTTIPANNHPNNAPTPGIIAAKIAPNTMDRINPIITAPQLISIFLTSIKKKKFNLTLLVHHL